MNKLVKPITNMALAAMLLLSIAVMLPKAFAVPQVSIDPASNIFYSPPVGITDTFTVDVRIDNVTDMFAYEFKIYFKNDTIGPVSAVRPAGHFLEPIIAPGNEFIPVWALEDVNATWQSYHLGYTRLAPETGETGSGVLIELTFEVLVEPPWGGFVDSPIHIYESKVADTVPDPIVHNVVDGYYQLNWAPPTTNPDLSVEPTSTVLGAGAPLVGTPSAFFTVDVWVNNADADWRMIGVEFKLAYNDTLIDFISLTNASWVSAFGDIYVVPVVEGTVGGLAYVHTAVILLPHITGPPAEWTTYIAGSGALVRLTFEVVMQEEFPWVGVSPLDLYDIKFSDENADPITGAAESDGTVTILGFIVGRNIDVYTQYPGPYGGQGPYNPADAYAPQDLVCLYANVTYNLDPVQNKAVDFEVKWPDGTPLLTRTAITDIYGVAMICFRIPWPDQISPEDVFGIWNVTAVVDIANEVVNDTLTFKVDWLMEVVSIETAEEFQKQKPAPLGEMWFKVCWEVRSVQERPAIITVVVYDDLGVPIAWAYYAGNFSATVICTPVEFCYNFTLYIPTWAYVGPATVYANIYTDFPQNGGHSYAPEQYAEFRIVKP
jgi:hypothetical protein